MTGVAGVVFDIQHYSISDGPGIRTTVFLKGCPLACLWCSNPESQNPFPELFHLRALCHGCRRCVEICPAGAHRLDPPDRVEVDRDRCTACGTCAAACPAGARAVSGRTVSVEEVVEAVQKDSLFYRNSGGGVTVSGGEPAQQPVFVKELLRRCRDLGLHTAVETCGYAPWTVLGEVLEHADLVLFDLKHVDPAKHERLTGVGNELILANLERLSRTAREVVIRLPLIPGCNGSRDEVIGLGECVRKLGYAELELLPYHRLGTAKYANLGRSYPLENLKLYGIDHLLSLQHLLLDLGLRVAII